jgi:hypothetical protein
MRRVGAHLVAPAHALTLRAQDPQRAPTMSDAVFFLITTAFFAISLAYLRGCDRL